MRHLDVPMLFILLFYVPLLNSTAVYSRYYHNKELYIDIFCWIYVCSYVFMNEKFAQRNELKE